MISAMSVVKSPVNGEFEADNRFCMSGTSENNNSSTEKESNSSFLPISAFTPPTRSALNQNNTMPPSGSFSADGKNRYVTRPKKQIMIPALDKIQTIETSSKIRPPRSKERLKVPRVDVDEVPVPPRGASSPKRSASPNFESTLRRTKTPDISEDFWIQDLRGRMKSSEALQLACNNVLEFSAPKSGRNTDKRRTEAAIPATSASPRPLSPSAFAVPGEVDVGDVYILRNMSDMAACQKSAQYGFSWWGLRESGFLRVELEKGKHLKPYISTPRFERSVSLPSTAHEPLITIIEESILKRQISDSAAAAVPTKSNNECIPEKVLPHEDVASAQHAGVANSSVSSSSEARVADKGPPGYDKHNVLEEHWWENKQHRPHHDNQHQHHEPRRHEPDSHSHHVVPAAQPHHRYHEPDTTRSRRGSRDQLDFQYHSSYVRDHAGDHGDNSRHVYETPRERSGSISERQGRPRGYSVGERSGFSYSHSCHSHEIERHSRDESYQRNSYRKRSRSRSRERRRSRSRENSRRRHR